MKRALLATAFLAMTTVAAAASSISVNVYSGGNLADFQADMSAKLGTGSWVGEDFESLGATQGEGVVGSPLGTAVGTFAELGGTGSGGTVKELGLDSSSNLALRDGNVYGRVNTWPTDGSWFLDSNDTWGFVWTVDIGGAFDSLMFALTDGSDQGAYLRVITDDGTAFEQRATGAGALGNGNIAFVEIDFGGAVTSAQITVGNFMSNADGSSYRVNDGVGIDAAFVNAVPLPAGMWLMLGSFGGLAAMRRRRG